MAKAVVEEHKDEEDKSRRDKRPNLSISTEPLGEVNRIAQVVYRETDKYSITPTTFESRNFFPPDASVIDRTVETIKKVAAEKENFSKRLEEFKRREQESIEQLMAISRGVVADGEFAKPDKDILALSEKFIPKITALELYYEELNKYLDFIKANQDLILTYSDKYANDSSEVTRFGINTATMDQKQSQWLASIYTPIENKGSIKSGSSKGGKADQASLKMLHPLEVFLIRDAIDCLKRLGSKSVLVDIFARNDDGSITINDDKPEAHTIVLYIQKDTGKIIVIDPSNPDFSKHLPNNSIRLFREGDEYVEVIAPLKQKIYAPANKANVGPGTDQYRDCIDIAVKIAFGLNLLEESISEIMSLDIIAEITNQQDVMDNLFFNPTQAIARIRQASDDVIREKANKLLVNIDKQIKAIDAYPGCSDLDVQIKAIMAFSKPYTPDQYKTGVRDLLGLYQQNGGLLKAGIDKAEAELLGDIDS